MQCVQCSVAVLGGGSLVHVPEALHGRDVPLDTLLGEVKLGHKCQRSAIVTTEQHGATVMALKKVLTSICVGVRLEMGGVCGLYSLQLLRCSLKRK